LAGKDADGEGPESAHAVQIGNTAVGLKAIGARGGPA
jgi:hypothetical protein